MASGGHGRVVRPATPQTGLCRIEKVSPAAPLHAGHRAAFAIVIVGLGLLVLANVLSRKWTF